ncbi:hypothetical protein EDD22DRAFT_852124 [Suillus occidentalis]|nr:hypothetical protein EDD22DRAFT_852124 [Suillus occidentalis]
MAAPTKKTSTPGVRHEGAVEQFESTSLLGLSQRSPRVAKHGAEGETDKALQLERAWENVIGAVQVEASHLGSEVVPLRVKVSPVIRHSTKRGVDGSNKENIGSAPKRICREKTGTEWQTFLDLVKYDQEQNGDGKGLDTPQL